MSNLENQENPEIDDEMDEDPPSEESTWANGQVPQGSDPLAEDPAAADQTASEEEYVLPQALRNLINISGVKFRAVPETMWKVDGWPAKLKRSFSVTFSADIEVSSADILEVLLKTEVDPDKISAIQYRVFSANVENTGESTPSYMDSRRENRPATPAPRGDKNNSAEQPLRKETEARKDVPPSNTTQPPVEHSQTTQSLRKE
ncbi:hypothetical protein ACROYT_G003942 [Oculina patagonica]